MGSFTIFEQSIQVADAEGGWHPKRMLREDHADHIVPQQIGARPLLHELEARLTTLERGVLHLLVQSNPDIFA